MLHNQNDKVPTEYVNETALLLNKWKKIWSHNHLPIELKNGENGPNLTLTGESGDEDEGNLMLASICEATGCSEAYFGAHLLQQYASVVNPDGKSESEISTGNSFLKAMHAQHPQDEIEGMLLTQILSLHSLGMKCMSRAANPKNDAIHVDRNVNNLTKLLRLQHETIETLSRYRRKGAQQIVVQHVNVNQGGRAIVGTVNQGMGGDMSENQGRTP